VDKILDRREKMAAPILRSRPHIPTNLIEELDLSLVQKTMQKIATFQNIIGKTLKKEHDYGVIPGTAKPTLLKPGGEKICMMLGVNPEYVLIDSTQDYEKGFFAYSMKCTLKKSSRSVAQGVGSCNSFEKRYRWVNSDVPPQGVEEEKITSFTDKYGRVRYKVPHPNPCDLANTILKIAKKRAFIDAVLQVASLSEIFTQDLEDMEGFVQEEKQAATESMTLKEASGLKVTFGKYKGNTLKEIYKEDPKYFEWIATTTNDDLLKKACEMMLEAAQAKKE
jgi:hypothetical protein